ncbi:MAG: FAD-binding oxidoreductase [Anaerolineae bacterium]
MKSTADVVIIGGGIQGLSLAYHLTKVGVTDVCLVEMNTLGSGSSGRSAAIIGFAFPTELCLPLTRWSFEALLRFEEELDADPGYEPIGCLLLAGAEGAPQLRQRHARLRHLGVESHLVDRRAIAELTPGMNLEDIEVGLYNAREGCLDPHSIMMAYAGQARRQGVEFAETVQAIGLEFEVDRVVGVHTTKGMIATACVVNAAGFYARKVASWAGMDLPIVNLKRHIFVTGPVAAYSRPIPFTYEVELPWYMRREGPGLLIGMGSTEVAEGQEEDPQVDRSFLSEVIEHSIHRAPPLEEAGVKTGWAGLRPVTPDKDPILGPAPQLDGFWNDCGWGGQGIMNAPAAGMALAEWIVGGETTLVDVSGFGADRLAPGKAQ